jgi:hypothetical protein
MNIELLSSTHEEVIEEPKLEKWLIKMIKETNEGSI